ncbi:MAG: hypothetical protein RLZZ316_755 [Bacteroidota bacterium]
MHKRFLIIAALLGAVSVAMGAFGAHGLKQFVAEESISTFETGVRYQFYHVFGLLALSALWKEFPVKWLRWAGNCFITGIVLFSGSLYLLTALKATNTVGLNGIGIITPIGGLFFIAGWLLIAAALFKTK